MSHAMLIRIFLGFIAASFLGFGLWSLLDPLGMTSRMDVSVSGQNAIYEMRGAFGGISLGGALLAAAGALKPARFERPALWFLAAYMGGYTISRAFSVIAGDAPTMSGWLFGGFEVGCFIITCIALRSRSKRA